MSLHLIFLTAFPFLIVLFLHGRVVSGTIATKKPSPHPTNGPTFRPSPSPSKRHSSKPSLSRAPYNGPTVSPTNTHAPHPSVHPTTKPTLPPTYTLTRHPVYPSISPTKGSKSPTILPSLSQLSYQGYLIFSSPSAFPTDTSSENTFLNAITSAIHNVTNLPETTVANIKFVTTEKAIDARGKLLRALGVELSSVVNTTISYLLKAETSVFLSSLSVSTTTAVPTKIVSLLNQDHGTVFINDIAEDIPSTDSSLRSTVSSMTVLATGLVSESPTFLPTFRPTNKPNNWGQPNLNIHFTDDYHLEIYLNKTEPFNTTSYDDDDNNDDDASYESIQLHNAQRVFVLVTVLTALFLLCVIVSIVVHFLRFQRKSFITVVNIQHSSNHGLQLAPLQLRPNPPLQASSAYNQLHNSDQAATRKSEFIL